MSKFGGHETFHLREGWLPTAMRKLEKKPALFRDKFACDELGVGRNMAKSIAHWLNATQLVAKPSRGSDPEITELGELILRKDPYFLRPGTWWALHINIVSNDAHAFAWNWLFNYAYLDRFDRYQFAADIQRHLKINGGKASNNTLAKDISCLLSSYSVSVPPEDNDPEEGKACPFQSLGLITHLKETGTYKINRKTKQIPAAIVGYAFAKFVEDVDGEHETMPLSESFTGIGSPGKTLSLGLDEFIETLHLAEAELGAKLLHVELSGAERTVRVRKQTPLAWMQQYYKGLKK